MVEMEIWGVSDGRPGPVVLLRNEDRVLPIVINFPEANAIQMGLMGQKFGRPMTHDLICNVLAGLRGTIKSVNIYKIEDDTYYAYLDVEQRSADNEVEQVLRIDARPSDGMAIAVRLGCPIYAAEEVLDSSAQDMSSLGLTDDEDAD